MPNPITKSLFHRCADNLGMAVFIAALFFLISVVPAQAQDWFDVINVTPERLIGLLDLDDIVQGGCGPAPNRATARLFAAPSETGPSVGMLYWHEVPNVECALMFERTGGVKEVVPTLESGYEIPAAIVFEQRGSWFRIRLAQGSAWIRRIDASDFLPYPEMLKEQLAYVRNEWDGTLRATPSHSGKVTPLTKGWSELLDRAPSIEYLGSRRVGGELWVHIKLVTESICRDELKDMTPVSGWLPAYRPNRAPSLWFSSRGC